MASSRFLISSTTLTGSQTTVSFSSIPSIYTDLVLRVSARTDAAVLGATIYTTFNSDTGTTYSFTTLFGTGSSTGSSSTVDNTQINLLSEGTSATSNTFSSIELYIPSYTASQNKPMGTFQVYENNATENRIQAYANLWRNTAALTSISMTPSSGNFVSGSSFYLYGIKSS